MPNSHLTTEANALEQKLNHLEETMHEAERSRTLEEQVADMKRRGIDPRDSFKKWDDEEEDN
ncbi:MULTISPECIES: hypothetical protein [unclassified Moraxella]|uniref:hypothetical protein n=1 Tax=unclassified Moraxella TaxID=2685852 RepID=UPI003AF48C36